MRLRTRKCVSYKSLAAGTSNVKETLPLGDFLQGVMVYNSVAGGNQYYPIKLSVNNGKKAFYDGSNVMLMMRNRADFQIDTTVGTLELQASGDVTTSYMYIPVKPAIDTYAFDDVTLYQERPTSSTCVIITDELLKA